MDIAYSIPYAVSHHVLVVMYWTIATKGIQNPPKMPFSPCIMGGKMLYFITRTEVV
jgi:hypothetical protein